MLLNLLIFIGFSNASDSVLWDSWYTMTLRGTVPYATYHETARVVGGKIQIRTEMTKLEDGFLNTEHYGSFSDAGTLRPLTLNSIWTERDAQSRADLEFSGNILSGKIEHSGQPVRTFKQKIPKDVFLSSSFNVWLARQIKDLKPHSRKGFLAIQENFAASHLSVESGWVELQPTQAQGQSLVLSQYGGTRFIWTLDSRGKPLRIERPDIGLVTELSTKEKAQKFLAN